MSHEIVKSISIKKDSVYITSAVNNVRPLYFQRWEWESASEACRKEGRLAALALIGKNIWDGNFHLYKGSRLCNLFLKAHESLPRKMSFMNFDSEIAGLYLGKMVMKLESNLSADLTPEVNEMLGYRNNRDHILNAAKVKGYNYLNYADDTIQADRDFALQVLQAGGGCAWFDYPLKYRDDKDFAAQALTQNGCFYRNLDESLKQDRELILLAFQEDFPERKFHEHLPDLIPESALFSNDHTLDSTFVCNLLTSCPSLHLERASYLLADPVVAKKWCEVGTWFPHSASHLPDMYLKDASFQEILLHRCDTDKKLDCLKDIYQRKGILLPLEKASIASQIQKAEARKLPSQESKDSMRNPPMR